MIAPITYQQPSIKIEIPTVPVRSTALSRMFAAAIVSQQFCEMLLSDPVEALRKGYLGDTFGLSHEERDLVISIHADSLSDLARQVNRSITIQR